MKTELEEIGIGLIRLTGLNNQYNIINEVVVMNGTTGYTTTNHFQRVNSLLILGSTGEIKAVGNITFNDTISTNSHGMILSGDTSMFNSKYCIPNGYVAILSPGSILGGGGSNYVISINFRTPTTTLAQTSKIAGSYAFTSSAGMLTMFPAETDLVFRAIAIGSPITAGLSVNLLLKLVPLSLIPSAVPI